MATTTDTKRMEQPPIMQTSDGLEDKTEAGVPGLRRKRGWPKGRPRPGQRHNLKTLKRAVKELGARTLDGRTSVGRALATWRAQLESDLGGHDALSAQQQSMIDVAMRTKLMLDSIDAWLLSQPSLINKRKRTLLPVVRERTQLADSLARHLSALGLERRAKPTRSLQDFLVTRSESREPPTASAASDQT